MISAQVDWTRKDFRSFLNAMERRGRDEVDVIARETSNETGKTEEEVRRYHTVFWARHKELADWERVIDKIEKGEKRLQRSKEIREALAEKIARSPKPHECLPLNYGASRGKVWTEEEDAYDAVWKSNCRHLTHRRDVASAHWLISTQVFVEHDAHLRLRKLGAD